MPENRASDGNAPETGPPFTSQAEETPGPNLAGLAEVERKILDLRRQRFGYDRIARETRLSKNGVKRRIAALQRKGFPDPKRSVKDASKKTEVNKVEKGPALIASKAAGAATSAAARTAANMAVETTDELRETGRWAWEKFNELARLDGYTDIYSWLSDCVEYWKMERQGLRPLLDKLHMTEQRNEELQGKVKDLEDRLESRRELYDMVFATTLAGRPIPAESLQVLMFGNRRAVWPRSTGP